MPTETIFGPFVSPWDVERAVLATLRLWLPEYLTEIERQHELPQQSIPRPPEPESFEGSTDFLAWRQDSLPQTIVVVEPVGEPELDRSSGYGQTFEVQVGTMFIGDDEIEARRVASMYGAAHMLLVQQGDLQGFAQWTRIEDMPRVELPDPSERRVALARTKFAVHKVPVVVPQLGPTGPTPRESPFYGGEEEPWKEFPEVKETHVNVTAEPVYEGGSSDA